MGVCFSSHPTRSNKIKEGTTSSLEDIRQIYRFEKVLGAGSFGVVRLVSLKVSPEVQFAMKMIEKEKVGDKIYLLRRELDILKCLDHPNIIKFYETYQDERYLYFVMEYCAGGELLERLLKRKSLSENHVSTIIFKLFSALNYLHRNKICHRDIKLENILFKDSDEASDIKLIDFGLSVKLSDIEEGKGKAVGTPLYLAPEVLKGKYKETCDIWSAGIMAYILLSGVPPFSDGNEQKLFDKINEGKFTFDGPIWESVSKLAKDLISKCLVVNPSKRIKANQALKHPWFGQHIKVLSSQNTVSETNHDILENLRNFKPGTRLKKEVLKVLVNHMSEKDVKSLRDSFLAIDMEQTGVITVEQLQQVMKMNGLEETEEHIRSIIKTINKEDNDETIINYSDFIAASLNCKKFLNHQKMWSLFKYFDPTNNNYITVEDLKLVFAREGRKISDEDIQNMIQECKTGSDGKLNFENFCKMMEFEEDSLADKELLTTH